MSCCSSALGHDHVADPRLPVQAAGGAGEDRPLDAELAGEQRRRRRRRHLADAESTATTSWPSRWPIQNLRPARTRGASSGMAPSSAASS